ncbi:hypothetical protein JOB18_035930 [Solea senegalensis]|uniref:Uncharacterized protein n=1 Tax=Solea senegalensis TaxID=28829 RepID=A0AAV6S3F4_SOLSE|nr:hypothetical protein JOB18_035930 [Solea senegalensis]
MLVEWGAGRRATPWCSSVDINTGRKTWASLANRNIRTCVYQIGFVLVSDVKPVENHYNSPCLIAGL